jgi:GxxExxY protein
MQEETGRVIGAAIAVHRELGPGLLESAYAECLALELGARCIPYAREVTVPLHYRGIRTAAHYRLDFVAFESVLVELKAVDQLHPIHVSQVLTYLRLSGLKTALLINFNVPILRDGIKRLSV